MSISSLPVLLLVWSSFICLYSRSVRPSGSESLPGAEASDPAVYEDVSTCAVTDFQVLDSIPEQAPLDGESLSDHSSDACLYFWDFPSLASISLVTFLNLARCGF